MALPFSCFSQAKHLLWELKEPQIFGPFGFTQPEVLTENNDHVMIIKDTI